MAKSAYEEREQKGETKRTEKLWKWWRAQQESGRRHFLLGFSLWATFLMILASVCCVLHVALKKEIYRRTFFTSHIKHMQPHPSTASLLFSVCADAAFGRWTGASEVRVSVRLCRHGDPGHYHASPWGNVAAFVSIYNKIHWAPETQTKGGHSDFSNSPLFMTDR